LLLPAGEGGCSYHRISRLLEQKFVMDSNEKEIFVAAMREQEAFSGVRVLTYCTASIDLNCPSLRERPAEVALPS
jgi:hypothetical protein